MDDDMRAVMVHDFGEWSVESVPRPEPGPGEVLLEVKRVQLSVTECQRFHGVEIAGYEDVRDRIRAADGGARLFGHEFCGEVVDAGEGVSGFEVGDRVFAPAKIPCDDCAYCKADYPRYCENKATLGTELPGALAEYIAVPTGPLRTVPEGVSDAEAAAMQPLASAVLCVRDGRIETGDVVGVIGTGVMGYQCGQLALEEGAGEVYAVDVVDRKLEHARDRGMTPIDAREVDPVEAIREATDGVGADVVYTAVGGEQSHMTDGDGPLANAFDAVRVGGTIVQVGLIAGEIGLRPRAARSKSVRWINPERGVLATGPNADTGSYAAELVASGRVSIGEYLTHELDGLDSFGELVEITLNKDDHGALGPAQIVVS